MERAFSAVLLAIGLIGAAPSGRSELEDRFATGTMLNAPAAGAQCMGSDLALGTSDLATAAPSGVLGSKASSVVNIWAIRRKSDASIVGYVAKTFDGVLWYEAPVEGLNAQKLDDAQSHMLANQPLTFTSCFQNDLPV
jgi:hypothetical protein